MSLICPENSGGKKIFFPLFLIFLSAACKHKGIWPGNKSYPLPMALWVLFPIVESLVSVNHPNSGRVDTAGNTKSSPSLGICSWSASGCGGRRAFALAHCRSCRLISNSKSASVFTPIWDEHTVTIEGDGRELDAQYLFSPVEYKG